MKRAGYVLMAELAAHDKNASDKSFVRFFAAIERGSEDERNFVRKAVNWALRQTEESEVQRGGAESRKEDWT